MLYIWLFSLFSENIDRASKCPFLTQKVQTTTVNADLIDLATAAEASIQGKLTLIVGQVKVIVLSSVKLGLAVGRSDGKASYYYY